jgi:Hydrazine synthase alpha subunit middle domain
MRRPGFLTSVRWRATLVALLAMLFTAIAPPARADQIRPLPYDLLYVRAPYFGADAASRNSSWPDTVRPLTPDPGAQLMVLRTDGSREVLFPLERYRGQIDTPRGRALAVGSVADPNVSFDGRQVVFAWYHDLTTGNPQRGGLSRAGADLYKLDLTTRALTRLTFQEFTPNTGNGARFAPGAAGSSHPRIGVFNTGATWVAGGRIVFTSTRNGLLPPKELSAGQRVLQLFAMDDDGANVEQIGHLNLAMALHPQVLLDGRVAFSSWEEQGVRDPRQFALWVIGPDGRDWHALSGFAEGALAHHFMTQMPGGDLVVARYYNLNNNGFGDLVRFPLDPPGPDFGSPDAVFGDVGLTIPFERVGQRRLAPWTTPDDFPAPCPGWEDDAYGASGIERPSPCLGEERRGKLTHPAAAPSAVGDPARADLLAVYAPGPANHNGIYESLGTAFPRYRGEIVLLPDGEPVPVPAVGQPGLPAGLVTVLAEDGFNLQWPRPIVSWQQLYGVAGPAARPAVSAAGRALGLPPGEPFGVLGSASLLWRDTAPSFGRFFEDRDPFNTGSEAPFRWVRQGSDAGVYSDDDVYAVRILMLAPATDRTYPDDGPRFQAIGGERLRILGEIPVRKRGAPPVPRPDGTSEPDTSFLARVPADVALTFQALDRRGLALNMAQTWHQVRPAEARYDCGGCHAHSREPVDIAQTAAGRPGFAIPDLARTTPLLTLGPAGRTGLRTLAVHQVSVEYQRDVAPILESRCASCHSASAPAAGLPLTRAVATVERGGQRLPGSYFRLVLDSEAELSPPPPPGEDRWWLPQLTRWVRAFQARQSLLLWKVWGERLDGRTNAERDDDLDLLPSAAHPAGIGVRGMPPAEKLTLARWIDLGAPIDLATGSGGSRSPWGFFEDDLRPTLVVRPTPAEARAAAGFDALEIAAFDVESGVAPGSLTVTCNLRLGAFAAGSNLAAGRTIDPEGRPLRLLLPRRVRPVERAVFTISVRDAAGHQTVVRRTYKRR